MYARKKCRACLLRLNFGNKCDKSQKKKSVFCNGWVCGDHIVKKREDLLVPGEFAEICSKCEDLILTE